MKKTEKILPVDETCMFVKVGRLVDVQFGTIRLRTVSFKRNFIGCGVIKK